MVQYSVPVTKYNRNGFKPRPRQLVLTQTAAYVVDEAKIKQRVLYAFLKGGGQLGERGTRRFLLISGVRAFRCRYFSQQLDRQRRRVPHHVRRP